MISGNDTYLRTIVIIMAVALSTPALALKFLTFTYRTTPAEKTVLAFAPTPEQFASRPEWRDVAVACPVSMTAEPVKSTVPLPPPALAQLANRLQKAAASGQKAEPESQPQVTFIMHDPVKSIAIIDGHLLARGDRFLDWRVSRIEQKRVMIEKKGVTKWLYLD